MSERPYIRDELRTAGTGFPERGLYCESCKTRIPQFADLADEARQRVLELRESGDSLRAMEELKAATGCSTRWAKIWVLHSGVPSVRETFPCPHCGEPLRSPEARQCRHCKRDWHDPKRIRRLGAD